MPTKIRANINVPRIVNDYKKKVHRQRMMVKSEIAKDCGAIMPHGVTGDLQKSSAESIRANDPYLIWNIIYAKFLYYGKVMIGVVSHSPWAKRDEDKKVTSKNIKFGKDRKPFWFEYSKQRNKDKWIRLWAKGVK